MFDTDDEDDDTNIPDTDIFLSNSIFIPFYSNNTPPREESPMPGFSFTHDPSLGFPFLNIPPSPSPPFTDTPLHPKNLPANTPLVVTPRQEISPDQVRTPPGGLPDKFPRSTKLCTHTYGFKATLPSDLTEAPTLPSLNTQRVYVSSITRTNTDTSESSEEEFSVISHPSQKNKLVGKSMIIHLFLNNIPVVAFIDPGSDVNLISPACLRSNSQHIRTVPTNIELIYANNDTNTTQFASFGNKLHTGGTDFVADANFLISPTELPNIDIILGNIFLDSNNVLIQCGSFKSLIFPNGAIWYDNKIQSHFTSDNIRVSGCEEAANFMKISTKPKARKRTSNKPSRDEVEAAVIYIHNDIDHMEPPGEPGATSTEDGVPIKPEGPDSFPRPERFYKVIRNNKLLFRITVPEPSERKFSNIVGEGMEIKLKPDVLPAQMRAFPMSHGEQLIMEALIKDLIEKGYVEPADPGVKWACPVMLLKKKGNRPGIPNQFRMVCDFRRVNRLTDMTSSAYTPPLIRDMFRMLAGAKVFSITDLVGGYYQLPLHPNSRDYATIVVLSPEGPKKYRFKCITLGLSGAPSYFQSVVEQVLHGIKGVLCYIDDFIIFSETVEEHIDILEKVFARLHEHGLYLHPGKCEWMCKTIEFLGNKISNDLILPADDKVAALKTYAVPTSMADVRRFLGFCQYLAHLIPHFNDRASPLSDLIPQPTVKNNFANRKFIWTAACQETFETLRDALCNCTGLHLPSKNAKFVLETDASCFGVGACLYELRDSVLFPCYFISKKFNKAERNYAPRDLEALAIVFALVKFRSYLYQGYFTLYSDHQSLEKFKTQPNLKNKDWRWQELMSLFDFEHKYRAGATMLVPDALSRSFGKNPEPDELGVEDTIESLFSPLGVSSVNIKAFSPTAEHPQVVPLPSTPIPVDGFTNVPNLPISAKIPNFPHSPKFSPTNLPSSPTLPINDPNFPPPSKAQISVSQLPGEMLGTLVEPSALSTDKTTPTDNTPTSITNIQSSSVPSGFSGIDFTFNVPDNITDDIPDYKQFQYLLDDDHIPLSGSVYMVNAKIPPQTISSDINTSASLPPPPDFQFPSVSADDPWWREEIFDIVDRVEPSELDDPATLPPPPPPLSTPPISPSAPHNAIPLIVIDEPPDDTPPRLSPPPISPGNHLHPQLSYFSPAVNKNCVGNLSLSPSIDVPPPFPSLTTTPATASEQLINTASDTLINTTSSNTASSETVSTSAPLSPTSIFPILVQSPNAKYCAFNCAAVHDHVPSPANVRSGIYQAAVFQKSVLSTVEPNWRDKLPPLYQQDPFFKNIYDLCQSPNTKLSPQQRAVVKYYTVANKLLFYTNCDTDGDIAIPRLCIPVSTDNYLRRLIIFESHDALLHQSRDKTFLRSAKQYYWPQMRRDIRRYVNSCPPCRTLKTQQRPARGFMSSPAIPFQRMSEIHIDFMVGLQETPEGYDSVLIVVCGVSGFLMLIPCSKHDRALQIAQLLFKHIFYMHGAPTVIHSDRDPKFISAVFECIMGFFNIQRKMSTSYNHDPNGKAEISIKTVEVLLRHVLSHHPERHFNDFLPLSAYAYNSSVKKDHGHTPHMVLFGFEPSNPSILLCDTFDPPTADQLPTKKLDSDDVTEFILHQQVVLREVKDAIQASQRTMEIFQNDNRRDIKFQPGEKVYLDTRNLGPHYFARSELKLHDKFFGPFTIMEQLSSYTYRLQLPHEMRDLYNVFHVALLWKFVPTDPDLQPLRVPDFSSISSVPDKAPLAAPTGFPTPAQLLPDAPAQLDDGEYIVESILARRKRGRGYQYFVKWKNFPDSANQWISRSSAATEGLSQDMTAFDATCDIAAGVDP